MIKAKFPSPARLAKIEAALGSKEPCEIHVDILGELPSVAERKVIEARNPAERFFWVDWAGICERS